VAEIRLATEADIDRMVQLGQAMQQESPRFSRLGYSDSKVRALGANLIANPDAVVLVGVVDDEIVGMLLGYVSEQFFSHAITASELVVYVEPAHRGGSVAVRMIHAFEVWAFEHGARDIVLGVSTEVDASRTCAFYERMGYAPSGNLLVKRCT
jgi:GNAT superfamily N-acetyltransferase